VGTISPEDILAPFIDVACYVTGAPKVGTELVSYKGAWIGADSFAYQWQESSDAGSTWTDVYDAVEATYTPVVGDVGKILRVQITGTNLIGDTVGESSATPDVIA